MPETKTLNLPLPWQKKQKTSGGQASLLELVERIAQAISQDGSIEPIKGLHLHCVTSPRENHSVVTPSFCLIAQGSKELFLGKERYQYDPAHYLLVTAKLPTISHVIEASKERPYFSLRLDLDPVLVSSVMVETGHASSSKYSDVRAIDVSSLDQSLLDAVLRLVRLVDSPEDAPFLAPLITKEIIYRLLLSEQSSRLCQIAAPSDQTHRIIRAIERLRQDFNQSLNMENLAEELGMSVSSFHHHFKAVTAMSPLQFQKKLRLQEARRLMLSEHLDAANAGFRVGYEDASHFNRDYKRLFGLPPIQDVERLRETSRDRSEQIISLVA
jgi:AraC-like DNA-binding protein